MDATYDDDFEYSTGPFCRHWSEPEYCEIVCAACGHKCVKHGCEDGMTDCSECDCTQWVEPEDAE